MLSHLITCTWYHILGDTLEYFTQNQSIPFYYGQRNAHFYLRVFRESLFFVAVYVDLNRRPIDARPAEFVDDSWTVREDDTQALKLEEQSTCCVTWQLDDVMCKLPPNVYGGGEKVGLQLSVCGVTWFLVRLLLTGSVYSKLSAFSTWYSLSSTANLCFTKDLSVMMISKSSIISHAVSMSKLS